MNFALVITILMLAVVYLPSTKGQNQEGDNQGGLVFTLGINLVKMEEIYNRSGEYVMQPIRYAYENMPTLEQIKEITDDKDKVLEWKNKALEVFENTLIEGKRWVTAFREENEAYRQIVSVFSHTLDEAKTVFHFNLIQDYDKTFEVLEAIQNSGEK